jgi:tryptophan halogenase
MKSVHVPLRIVIVGGGTAGWMTAAAFASVFKLRADPQFNSSSRARSESSASAKPRCAHSLFNKRIGIDERDLMAKTQATFKIRYRVRRIGRGWATAMSIPSGVFGGKMAGVPFHNYCSSRGCRAPTFPLESYSLPIVASREGKFTLPSEDQSSILSTFGYAFRSMPRCTRPTFAGSPSSAASFARTARSSTFNCAVRMGG